MDNTMFILLLVVFVSTVRCQDVAYPASTVPVIENQKREPLYAPARCPDNHLLYPGNQENDWICDCAPGYVYYPEKDGCFATFRQGPCLEGEYLTLKKNEFLPKCEKNPCELDGVVKYRGICHALNKPGGPCKSNVTEGTRILAVVKTTLELRCISGADTLALIKVPSSFPPCPPGSRRSNTNDCRRAISD